MKKRSENNNNNNNLYSTLIITCVLSLIIILFCIYVQSYQISSVNQQCSYLDPIMIDILAFIVGIFLVVEGMYSIVKHRIETLKGQHLRIIRVLIGFAILTIHVLQFLHK